MARCLPYGVRLTHIGSEGVMKSIYRYEVRKFRCPLEQPPGAAETPETYDKVIRSSVDAAALCRALIGFGADRESLIVLHLDVRNRVRGFHIAGVGGGASCAITPTQVFREVVASGAQGIIIAHNHPSGAADPSTEDIALTSRICAGAELLGIKLLDHVIVTDTAHFSFLDAGILHVKVSDYK